MDAVRLAGVEGLATGTEMRLRFRLPGHKAATVLSGRVDPYEPGAAAIRVAIAGFDKGAERAYQQFVLARVGADALDRQAEALTTPAGRLVPLTDPRRIRDLLADSLAYKADTLVQGPELPQPVRALLTGVTPTELLLTSDVGGKGGPLAGTRVRCSLLSRHGPYLFEVDVRGRADGQLRLSFPERLHQYEKRGEPRVTVNANRPGGAEDILPDRIVLALPAVYGGPIERPLIDVSETGAAFRSRPGDPIFLPGTPLPGVVLVLNGTPGSPRPAEVRQVALEEAGDGLRGATYRVGLALDVERARALRGAHGAGPAPARPPTLFARASRGDGLVGRLVRAAQGPLEALRARAARLRRSPQAGGPLVNVVRYRARDGESIVSLVNSTQPIGRGGVRLRGPLVVIPPAYGKTKETYSALALMITETFRRHGRDVVVVRYDGTHAVGESQKEPENWPDERQMMRFTLSGGAADLLATLDYFHGRPWFRPTHTVVVSFSLAALSTRRAILVDPSARTTHWLSVVGAPDAQEVVFNATGGFDAIGGHQLGIRYGTVQVLNHLIDADHFSEDAIASGLATLQDARRDLARIAIPVAWFVGRDDRWVRGERVYDVMSVAAPAPREVIELPVGHTMRSSAEALASFDTIIRHIWRQVHGEAPVEVRADEPKIKRVAMLERGRLPRRQIGDARAYWSRYLVGDDGRGIGFDLWATTPAYVDLMDLQRQLLDVSEGDVVADLGAGTGNFTEHLLDRLARDGFRASPRRLVVADLVPAALEVASRKAERVLEGVLLPSDFLEFRELNLETSRLRPIRRFLSGEFASVEGLRGLVDGLPDVTLDAWLAVYDERLHAWLRGAAPDGPLHEHAGRLLRGVDFEVAVEFNRAARWTLGRLAPEDLSGDLEMSEARAVLEDPRSASARHLRFARLRFDGPGLADALPFPDASLDKAVMSLVLSYLFDPVETLREMHRILRPGGRLVASTMRPDADLSRAAEELVERIRTDPAVHRRFGVSVEEMSLALQRYINSAASLLDLEEGGVFRFFSKDEMRAILEQAGFGQVKVYESFGRPPQAFVAVGVKR
jgi:ubiquinone/menaquinone biosynthesis C-methylase UbiE